MFELITGLPPNYSNNKDEMYSNIMNLEPRYPDYLSLDAVDLLRKLLIKFPEERLGYNNGFSEVKEHAFFREIDWD